MILSGRSTRSSGCMTLQMGWLHGGANWQRWDGLRFFTNALLATDEELARGLDASTHIIDMTRTSRCDFF